MLSVLIPTLNEQRNIVDCLNSVAWADELVVVDSGSRDGTRELASRCGALVLDFQWNGRLPRKKNWAMEHVDWKNEWLLILDADERVTPALASEIKHVLTQPEANGYFINRRFMFLGRWIRHCGYFPSWNLRLFRHAKGRYENLGEGGTSSGDNEVHEHLVLEGPVGSLRHEMLHFAYPDIFTWVEKHNRYSDWEAAIEVGNSAAGSGVLLSGRTQRRKRWLRIASRQLPCRPLLRFVYSYILQRGFLDGYEGYVLCRLLASYEMLNVFKARELPAKASCRRSIGEGATTEPAAGSLVPKRPGDPT